MREEGGGRDCGLGLTPSGAMPRQLRQALSTVGSYNAKAARRWKVDSPAPAHRSLPSSGRGRMLRDRCPTRRSTLAAHQLRWPVRRFFSRRPLPADDLASEAGRGSKACPDLAHGRCKHTLALWNGRCLCGVAEPPFANQNCRPQRQESRRASRRRRRTRKIWRGWSPA